jgi:SIR2-like domain
LIDPLDDLARAIAERRAILFAGAGLSIPLGLPSWQELIERMCQELNFDPDSVTGPDGYRALAEFYRLEHGSVELLQRCMDLEWNSLRSRVSNSLAHKLIVTLDFRTIYTTNYDRSIEAAFDVCGGHYAKIANAGDLARADPGKTHIIKFHGDFEDMASLVITETDFLDRLRFDSALDIKLRADALDKMVLFIGYSMSDMNIRLLLHHLWRTWQKSGYIQDRPKSYVFMPHQNRLQARVLKQWGVVALTSPNGDAEEATTRFLQDLNSLVTQYRGRTGTRPLSSHGKRAPNEARNF